MAFFAYFDSTVPTQPRPVLGWYETDSGGYSSLPDAVNLLAMTAEQWAGRMEGVWGVQGGALVPYSPPVPPPTPQQILTAKIAEGIAITCTGDPSLSAVFALDALTMDQIGSVARDVASGLGFPDGETFTYPDAAGVPHTFTPDRLIALYKAQRTVLSRLNTAAAILANGGIPSWPDQIATIP